MNILNKILATKQSELEEYKASTPFTQIHDQAKEYLKNPKRKFYSLRNTLLSSDSGIIAEFKRRSPSKGFIKEGADLEQIVSGYVGCGATALSVLTDSQYFGGSADDLIRASAIAQLPILRKDFMIDPYQICQAKLWGADAILLIASALTPEKTEELALFAHSLSLEVLLEIHSEEELSHINQHIDVVGVNNRNLSTFETNVDISLSLADKISSGYVKISESGISDPSTVILLKKAGYKGFLMGENFMKQSDPAQALSQFISEL